uniref:Uncharacterized protein n=1 Tax=Glossina palpalis gambiensis TaxID=67801 RepID=A0A1B0B7I4_9MUSC
MASGAYSSSYALIVSHTQRQSGIEDEFCELYKLMALNTVNIKRNSKTAKHFNSSIKYRPYFSVLSNDNKTTAIVITLHRHKLHAHVKGQTTFDFQTVLLFNLFSEQHEDGNARYSISLRLRGGYLSFTLREMRFSDCIMSVFISKSVCVSLAFQLRATN